MTDERAAAQQRVHEAIQGLLADGELAVCWTLTIDVARPDGGRHLHHHAGGGHDGRDWPMQWTALGMLEASAGVARAQLEEGRTEDDG